MLLLRLLLAVIFRSYVICDGCRRRVSSRPAEPPSSFSSTIKLLSVQQRKVFSGTLVARYLHSRRWGTSVRSENLSFSYEYGGTYMNSLDIHRYREGSADLYGMEDLATCKLCLFSGRAKAVSRYARHFSVPVGLRMFCPACAAVVCQGAAIMG